MSTRVRKNSLPPKSCATISKIDQNFVPPFVPLFVLCDCHKRITSISYILRKFLQRSHKLNAKLNNNLEVIIKALFQSKSTCLPKVSKNNCFIVKNEYLMVARNCFVPATIIHDELDIKGNIMQQNSENRSYAVFPKMEVNIFWRSVVLFLIRFN